MHHYIKSIIQTYSKISNFGKIMVFMGILLILVVLFKDRGRREGYSVNEQFLFKKDQNIYDDFYATIYDYLVFNSLKTDYEIGEIINKTGANETSVVLDIGSGTGHHVAKLSEEGVKNVIGMDISPAMIKEAKSKYPHLDFRVGDTLDDTQFQSQQFTHILCLYFTVYYFKDKRKFFQNCMEWLMPGGHLIVHLVDVEKFDPILPPANPLYIVSPQKYAKERITKSKIKFDEFEYESNFHFDKTNSSFNEKIKFNDGRVRKHEQTLYMEDTDDILTIAQECGFIFQGKIDMVNCAYENQYLYIFQK
jgi:SAM-dependent methyltransferase